MDFSKTILLKGVICKNMYFLEIALFYPFMGLCKIMSRNSDHFQIEFLCFLGDKWTILRLFHPGEPIAKMNTFEILHGFIMGLIHFFEVKFRLLPNQNFTFSMG